MKSLPDYILYALAFCKFLAVPTTFDDDLDNNNYNSIYCGYYGYYWLQRLLVLNVGGRVSPTSEVRPLVRPPAMLSLSILELSSIRIR
jgi:hypothetical protein